MILLPSSVRVFVAIEPTSMHTQTQREALPRRRRRHAEEGSEAQVQRRHQHRGNDGGHCGDATQQGIPGPGCASAGKPNVKTTLGLLF